MDWEPAHADHSIESVFVILTYAAPLDPNTFDEILVAGRKAAFARQFTNRVEAIDPQQIQLQPGQQVTEVIFDTSAPARRKIGFQRLSPEGRPIGEFGIAPSHLSLTSSHYSSWTDFKELGSALISAIEDVGPILDKVKSIQLQYVDRFSSTVPRADPFQVISRESSLLAQTMSQKQRAFHSHVGWFDYINENDRKLTNVNVDLVDNSWPNLQRNSLLSILTMARREVRDGVLEYPLNELDGLHDYLKALFSDIITREASVRVSLND
jgi:uncharacterized protein (TIGR04255 family)